MIKKITAIAMLTAILASCSTSNEVVSNGFFQKRKYNKGWYANKSTKVKETKGDNTKEEFVADKSGVIEENTVAQSVVVKEEIKPISKQYITKEDVVAQPQKTVLASADKKEEKIVSTSVVIANEQNAVAFEELKKVSEMAPVEIKTVESKSGGDAGVALLLLVILAILLPPLAVFLVDGIGTKFWISLILTLLFWLPGMIYALLVVFGAV